MRKSLLIAAAAIVILLPAALLAGHHGAKGHDHPGMAMIHHALEQLNLTAAQKEQVHGVFSAHREELAAELARLKTGHEALRAAVHAPVLDEAAVRSAARSVGEVREDLAVTHARLVGEFRQILNAEQRQKAHEMLAGMHSRCEGILADIHAHLLEGPKK